jgi:serine/threonine-protein kinase
VEVIYFGPVEGNVCLVSEWMDGGSLEDQIRAKGPLPEPFVIQVAQHCLRALEACQKIRLVHGDIKPGNILFDAKGYAKLADFGIAHTLNPNRDWRRDIRGTAAYIAPEKAMGKNETHKSDLYSLAVVLWQALTGKVPFDAPEVSETVKMRFGVPPPVVRQANPMISRMTSHLLENLMDPDPSKRPGHIPGIRASFSRAEMTLERSQIQEKS